MSLVFRPPQRRAVLTPSQGLKIDWSHPLANGLIACYVPGISRGLNLVGDGANLSPITAVNNDNLTSEGAAFKTTVLPDGLKVVAPAAFLTSTNSLYWRGAIATQTGAGNTGTPLIGIQFSDPEVGPYHYMSLTVPYGSSNGMACSWNSGGSPVNSSSSATVNTTAGAINSFLGTFNVSGNVILYQNGAQFNSTAFGSSPTSDPTSSIVLQGGTAVDPTRAAIYSGNIACIWNRELSASEAAAIDSDPYCFLIPAEGEMQALFLASGDTFANFAQLRFM